MNNPIIHTCNAKARNWQQIGMLQPGKLFKHGHSIIMTQVLGTLHDLDCHMDVTLQNNDFREGGGDSKSTDFRARDKSERPGDEEWKKETKTWICRETERLRLGERDRDLKGQQF